MCVIYIIYSRDSIHYYNTYLNTQVASYVHSYNYAMYTYIAFSQFDDTEEYQKNLQETIEHLKTDKVCFYMYL